MFYFYKMKKILLSVSVFALVISCKKGEKIVDQTSTDSNSQTVVTDSVKVDSATVISAKDASPKVKPLNEEVDLGKVVFTQNNQVMIAFNTKLQTGKIVIDDKEYPLNKLTFSENNYEISGNGIKITAEEGNFKEMTSDCLYGNFPKVKIKLNDKEVNLENVSVQDCPSY